MKARRDFDLHHALDRLSRRERVALVAAHDAAMAALALPFALGLRVGFDALEPYGGLIAYGAPSFAALTIAVFWVSGVYRHYWRYAGARDFLALCRASAIAVALFMAAMFAVDRLQSVPRSAPLLLLIVLIVLLGGARLSIRLLLEDRRRRKRGQGERCLVIGSGETVARFARVAESGGPHALDVAAVLSYDERGHGRNIAGVAVFGGVEELGPVLTRFANRGRPIARVVVVDGLAGPAMRGVLASAQAHGVAVSRAPEPTALRDAEHMPPLRPIALEDLLGREEAELDRAAIARLIQGECVVITGAGGSIGAELAAQIANLAPSRLILLDHGEYNLYRVDRAVREAAPDLAAETLIADVRDRARVFAIFERARPALVFHAAALKHVPIVEANVVEGFATNGLGTKNVADAASRFGARAFVLISSDKAVNPANVMGATKRLAEFYCQAMDLAAKGGSRFMTVRFGNVLGSSGSVVPLFERQLAAGGPLTVTHPDIERYFMTVREAVSLILQASAGGLAPGASRGRIFVLDMGRSIKIVDLAKQVIRLAGLEPERDVSIAFTGLRPGEKLYEELFDEGELRLAGDAPGVLAAEPRPIGLAELELAFDRLGFLCETLDERGVRLALEAIVPGFDRDRDPKREGRPSRAAA